MLLPHRGLRARGAGLRDGLPDGQEGGLAASHDHLGAAAAFGALHQVGEIRLVSDLHARQLVSENFLTGRIVRQRNMHQAVESSRPHERGVQHVRAVRRREHHDMPPGARGADAVHLREQLCQHPRSDAAGALAFAAGAHGVDLVEEDDAGRGRACLAEDVAHSLLAVTDILREELRPLDGDEVHLSFRGHRLRHHGLRAAGRPIQQHTPGRVYVHGLEGPSVADGPLHGLPEGLLRRLVTSNVAPTDVGHFHQQLLQCRGWHQAHRGDTAIEVHRVPSGAQCSTSCCHAEGSKVGANVAVATPRELLPLLLRDLVSQACNVHLQDLKPLLRVRNTNLDLPLQAPGSAHRWVDGIGAVGCAEDDDGVVPRNAIDCGQKGGHHAPLCFRGVVSLWTDGIDLVDEQQRSRASIFGLLPAAGKQRRDSLLGLAHALADKVCSCNELYRAAELFGQAPSKQRLARARGSIEQHSSRRPHTKLAVQVGSFERQLHSFPQLVDDAAQASDAGEACGGQGTLTGRGLVAAAAGCSGATRPEGSAAGHQARLQKWHGAAFSFAARRLRLRSTIIATARRYAEFPLLAVHGDGTHIASEDEGSVEDSFDVPIQSQVASHVGPCLVQLRRDFDLDLRRLYCCEVCGQRQKVALLNSKRALYSLRQQSSATRATKLTNSNSAAVLRRLEEHRVAFFQASLF
mmetsp:Transcript_21852/g.75129  ORF Transcript_21852/g.75129 Transcript_21852/m.75129 type:complete len:690 (-) Transcript_21852:224-2293(-)